MIEGMRGRRRLRGRKVQQGVTGKLGRKAKGGKEGEQGEWRRELLAELGARGVGRSGKSTADGGDKWAETR